MKNHFQFNDKEFEIAFQDASLDPALFNHEAHLRLAWIQIKNHGFEKGIENVENQILNYVEKLNAKDKFNKTLTIAAVKIVDHFRSKSTSENFKDFIEEFPRLTKNFKSLVACHYGFDIFQNKEAKANYLTPDLIPFDR